MGEDHVALRHSSDRAVEQAIVALKKGAHLLKYSRKGKPKFCPFRLSMDEKFLIWYSGHEEKLLRLSLVIDVVHGQNAKQIPAERESQSFSIIYVKNGERALHLICKDKAQADSWFLGLKAIASRSHPRRLFGTFKTQRGAQSCINSPASYVRRKQTLGVAGETARSSQVCSISGSPPQSFSERCFPDGLSCSSDSFFSESSLASMHNVADILTPSSPYFEPDDLKKRAVVCANAKTKMHIRSQHVTPADESPQLAISALRDLLIWGEGAERGFLAGGKGQGDALLPKVLDSAMMLDVLSISLGGKHASLATKQGEVFCWGEGKRGRLGHKLDIDASSPKMVGSLTGVYVKSVTCGEYQTCALTDSGKLYAWGDSGCSEDFAVVHKRQSHWMPRKLSGALDGVSIVNVACGEWHTAVVSSMGQLFTFGDGTFGVLGHGNLQSTYHPKEVESLRGLWVMSVACGPWHTAAIVNTTNDHFKFTSKVGKLFTWGDGDKGKLGHSNQERKLLPTCITELVDHDFVQVCCGRMLTVGLTNMGKVYTMGSSVYGQLGNPQARDKSITVVQGKLKDEYVKEISVGSYHIAALASRGSLFTWGKGGNGQLGLGDVKDRSTPALVEALRDRKVEQITCGSNSTAAICLHKSTVTTDQSACRGCGTAFGFTRKKQNCYNCGLLFCRACCSKKATNASLAPINVKSFHVCDPCFNKLQRVADSGGALKIGANTPRPLPSLMSKMTISHEKEDKGEGSTAWSRMKSTRNYFDEKNLCEKQQKIDSASSLLNGLQRWGQVSCPEVFRINSREQTIFCLSSNISSLRNQLSLLSPASFAEPSSQLNSTLFTSANEEEDLLQSDKFLTVEVQQLRSQAETLKKLCQTREENIQECRHKIDEAWSLAKEEAAKNKAAKEVIKALTSRLHAMSEKLSAERDGNDQAGANLAQISSTCSDSSSLKSFCPVVVAQYLPPEIGPTEDRKIGSLCSSPIIFSSTLKFLRDKDYNGDTTLEDKSHERKADSGKMGIKSSKHEWIEQYQDGVYISLTMSSNGQKGLRRVRFSRKKFTKTQAERWWNENQLLVYQKYEVEGYTNLNQDIMVP